MILQSYNDSTSELKVFSGLTGYIVFEGIIHDLKLQQKIVGAIRKTESLACNYTKNDAIKRLEVM